MNNKHFLIYKKIEEEKTIYNKASSIFFKKNILLVYPTIFFTGLSSILSFTSNSDLFTDNTNKMLVFLVGVFTSLTTITQSLSSSLGYNTKSEMFRKAADSYDKILTKIEFEMQEPNEDNFMNDIEEKILQIKNECKHLPPEYLYTEYKNKNPKIKNLFNKVNIYETDNIKENNNINDNNNEEKLCGNTNDSSKLLSNLNKEVIV